MYCILCTGVLSNHSTIKLILTYSTALGTLSHITLEAEKEILLEYFSLLS